jgi:hypothetical protein
MTDEDRRLGDGLTVLTGFNLSQINRASLGAAGILGSNDR